MSRLLPLFLLAGCADEPAAPAPSRVDAVKATKPADGGGPKLDEFCEVRKTGADAPTFTWPTELDGGSAPGPKPGWTWVNLWATWCGPCVAEMPMITKWDQEMPNVDVALLSVDNTQAEVVAFQKDHPDAPSLRIAKFDAVGPWLTPYGLDANASIPIHIFVDPEQKVRCVRMGSVTPADKPAIEAILAGG